MNWRLFFFIAFLLTLFIFSWGASPIGPCHSSFVDDVLELHNKDGAANCVDFWLNRYQTLLTGMFAVAAAVIAFGQLREGRRQTAISRYEFFIKRLIAIKKIQKLHSEAQEAVRDSVRVISGATYGVKRMDELNTLEVCRIKLREGADEYHAPPGKLIEYEALLAEYTKFLKDIVNTMEIYSGPNGPHPLMQKAGEWPYTSIGRMQVHLSNHDAFDALLSERNFIESTVHRAFGSAH